MSLGLKPLPLLMREYYAKGLINKYCEGGTINGYDFPKHKPIQIYVCQHRNDCHICEVQRICNDAHRCGECDINWLKDHAAGHRQWWVEEGRAEAFEREKEKDEKRKEMSFGRKK